MHSKGHPAIMDKRMCLSEKMSIENNSANQQVSNGENFVHKVASSGLVLKFKVDKYGTPPPKHTISPQEVMMSGGKQNIMELLDNSEANSSTNAIHLLEQSEISAAEGTRSNKISLFDKAKVVPQDETDNKATMVHKCNECGKGFQEINSLHGHKGVHRREEYKRKRMMLEQQPITLDTSHVVSSQKTQGTKKDEIKKIRFAAQSLHMLSMEFKWHRPEDLSASMIFSNKHISAGEETDEMKEVSDIFVTLAQSFCKDNTMHVASSSSIGKRFVCTTCKKVFSSYNGLGGHMSIHNKKSAKSRLVEDGSTGSSSGGREQSIWKYVCDKCNMKFPTGHILGGHKRGHWWQEYYKMMALGDRNVKPRLPILLPRHETERSGPAVMPTNENIQPARTGLVVAAHTVPLACDGVQKSQQAMSPGNEIELPVPSGISDEDVA